MHLALSHDACVRRKASRAGVGVTSERDEAHDRAAYAFEGESNWPLHPDPVVRKWAELGFEAGFEAAWSARDALHAEAVAWLQGIRRKSALPF